MSAGSFDNCVWEWNSWTALGSMTPGDWVNGGACEQSDSAKSDPLYKKCQLYSDQLRTAAVSTEKEPRLPHLLCFFLSNLGGRRLYLSGTFVVGSSPKPDADGPMFR